MGTWDKYKTDENDQPGFVSLENTGDSFTGTLVSVEPRTIPAGTFTHQPEDLVVPSLVFRNRAGRLMKLDATATVLKNALIDESPEPGDEVTITRGAVPKGKRWIQYTVNVVRGTGSAEAPKKAEEKAAPKSKAPAPADDQPDF
jgi:hypothetical protein